MLNISTYSPLQEESAVSTAFPGAEERLQPILETGHSNSSSGARLESFADVNRRRTVSVTPTEAMNFNQASWVSCAANLANTVLGSGMLGIPYAFSNTGWINGFVLLILCACGSAVSLHFLSQCAFKIGGKNTSFNTVALAAIPEYAFIIDVAVAIKCFGVAISYLVVIGSLMPNVVESEGGSERFYI